MRAWYPQCFVNFLFHAFIVIVHLCACISQQYMFPSNASVTFGPPRLGPDTFLLKTNDCLMIPTSVSTRCWLPAATQSVSIQNRRGCRVIALRTRSTAPEISSNPVFVFPLVPLVHLAGAPFVFWKRDDSGRIDSVLHGRV